MKVDEIEEEVNTSITLTDLFQDPKESVLE